LAQAKAYAKKPRAGKAQRPFLNRNPPVTTTKARAQKRKAEEELLRPSSPSSAGSAHLPELVRGTVFKNVFKNVFPA